MLGSKRSRSTGSSFSLNMTPEPLFHDEEIACSGVNVQNPLWDTGTASLSSSSRSSFSVRSEDEDPLLPLSANQAVMASLRKQYPKSPPPPPKSLLLRCVEGCAMVLGTILILCLVGGIVAMSFVGSSEAWASPGLVILDDDDGISHNTTTKITTSGAAYDCPAWTQNYETDMDTETSFDRFIGSLAIEETSDKTFCDKAYSNECMCRSTLEPKMSAQPLSGDLSRPRNENLDVVLLGDTLIENCARGLTADRDLSGMADVCHHLFQGEDGSRKLNGIALGASRDRVGNLLYRLQEDTSSILDSLDPKVWWIQIGSNDLSEDRCSAESASWAMLPLVQAIKAKRPNAKIVVNSIISSSDATDVDDSLEQANRLISCFAEGSDDFEFFDGSTIFTTCGNDKSMKTWGEAIVTRVLEITS